ncbi:MAG TPA: hypothetical protein VFF58_00800 [Candidatus Nitrosotalea sp.]|nr:hypothetical protein [Candidatus Nitrosotalea sp.]
MTTKRPVNEFKLGRVKACVWANETSRGTYHTVTVGRLYRKVDGPWRTSQSLAAEDLLAAGKALSDAHTWILAQVALAAGRES